MNGSVVMYLIMHLISSSIGTLIYTCLRSFLQTVMTYHSILEKNGFCATSQNLVVHPYYCTLNVSPPT